MRRYGWTIGSAVAAAAVAGCGGGDDTKSKSAPAAAKPNTPTVQQVVAVARRNPGLAKCKKVSFGLLDNTPETPQEPLTIRSISCDGSTVGLWLNYRDAATRASRPNLTDRPYFVNGNVKVSTGEAILAHINADKWKTMPAELQRACDCGEVRQP